jgi:hypothetical protein
VNAARKKNEKKLGLFSQTTILRIVFKFVWAVYGGDLTGFCQSFRKVILKNDQRQTKSKKSQKVPGYEPLWCAHSAALPQSYPPSIGSGMYPLKYKALFEGGMHV